MTNKAQRYVIKGMQRDLSVSKFNPEFAYENMNIRITPREKSTLLSITNEKGNAPTRDTQGNEVSLAGTPLGHAVLNRYVVIFTVDDVGVGRIYRLEYKEKGIFDVKLIYKDIESTRPPESTLQFDVNHPIETLAIYENESIQKVYWIDGKNQTRVVNIVAEGIEDLTSDGEPTIFNYNSFDFVQKLSLQEEVTVTREELGSGVFGSGVIQYALSYYNLYGQQSNIFYVSDLLYTSFEDRGGNPEENISNSFLLTIDNPDTKFDYIRVYSIFRTSLNAVPTVKVVADLSIDKEASSQTITYIDTNTTGYTADPTELLYIGGEEVVFNTMDHKDGTLFLGNYHTSSTQIQEDLEEEIRNAIIAEIPANPKDPTKKSPFTIKEVDSSEIPAPSGTYPYNNELKYPSRKFKTFKGGETYRLGVQLQDDKGKWSNPIWIGDYNNHLYAENFGQYAVPDQYWMKLVQASINIQDEELLNKLQNSGYKKIRGVVVYPESTDREVLCQGILCPTVYNVMDRHTNTPFTQSSWFSRPMLPVDVGTEDTSIIAWNQPITETDVGIASNRKVTLSSGTVLDPTSDGAWAEFRHNYPLPGDMQVTNPSDKKIIARNVEIQGARDYQEPTLMTSNRDDITSWVYDNLDRFYVDSSIVSIYSPDIEFKEIDSSVESVPVKLRIVGYANTTANISDININTTSGVYKDGGLGFVKQNVGSSNLRRAGVKSLISNPYYIDGLVNAKRAVVPGQPFPESVNYNNCFTGFVTYAWHRTGALNNNRGSDGSGQFSSKQISNLKYCYHTTILDTPWEAYIEGDNNHTGITHLNIADSTENNALVRIPAPLNSGLNDLNYYFNVDKIVKHPQGYYGIATTSVVWDEDVKDTFPAETLHKLFSDDYQSIYERYQPNYPVENEWDRRGTQGVSIKYKSGIHGVIAFNYTSDHKQAILPRIRDINNTSQTLIDSPDEEQRYFWDSVNPEKYITGVYQDSINIEPIFGLFWMGELYRDKPANQFGGTSKEALENNNWVVAGESVLIGQVHSGITIPFTEGDTYYQRYDALRTYAHTTGDTNSVIDIVSFMCETRVNIDGRYDKNRGQESNLSMSPTNFNLLNPVYSQRNNFFSYSYLDPAKYDLVDFPTTITWTKEKILGEKIDTWTNITLASALDMDGDKGAVTSINRFNNELFCFQEHGFSNILFNSRTQITGSEGSTTIPIELANSGKVDGKRYIAHSVGTNNKWSIQSTPNGIYFTDGITNSLYLFNGNTLDSLSDKLGFRQWVGENITNDQWNPIDFNNFKTQYDENNNDVYFIKKDTCLVFSELLGQFTSFMSYENVPNMFNIIGDFFSIKDNKLWWQNNGNYNYFFNTYRDYYTTIVANPDSPLDKIFNILEYRADMYDSINDSYLSNETFDRLDISNEYQRGSVDLTFEHAHPSSLKKKFMTWRSIIPRDSSNKRDRIRSNWAYITLGKYSENTFRCELHDMVVHYTV